MPAGLVRRRHDERVHDAEVGGHGVRGVREARPLVEEDTVLPLEAVRPVREEPAVLVHDGGLHLHEGLHQRVAAGDVGLVLLEQLLLQLVHDLVRLLGLVLLVQLLVPLKVLPADGPELLRGLLEVLDDLGGAVLGSARQVVPEAPQAVGAQEDGGLL